MRTVGDGDGGERSAAVGQDHAPDRDDVLAMLAGLDGRPADDVPELIESMELAWLVNQVEQRYGVRMELDSGQYSRMTTVSGAADVLREVIGMPDENLRD
ncbi:hypothetical protein ACRAKI_20180 [Saccharothrix isguenensis]